MNARYLIIGNSIAGIKCIEGIREIDKNGSIIVVSEEDCFCYSRPLISYYLAGKINEEALVLKSDTFYKENDVKLFTGTTAIGIDTEAKKLFTSKQEIKFDRLLIATGGKPIIPEIEGYSEKLMGIFTFTSLSDARILNKYIDEKRCRKGVILGGGLIGLKCAEGLINRGLNVYIIEMADRLLPATLDKEASEIIEKELMEKLHCEVLKQDTIRKIEHHNGTISGVSLASGKHIETNLLVIAVGVRPNIDLVKKTPIKYNRGIVVDEYMRTNIPYIYAAGDVAEGKDMLMGRNAVIAIWPVAAKQGKIAGINMANGNRTYNGLFPMNAVDIAGCPVISFGITHPLQTDKDKYEIMVRRGETEYKKVVIKNNRIIGCIFLGKIDRSGIFQGLIRHNVDISNFRDTLLDDNFGLLVLPAEYRKHIVMGESIEV
jgi:NAD(P)H-nitrite reductase large subunit